MEPVEKNLNIIAKIEKEIDDINFKDELDDIKNEVKKSQKTIILLNREKIFIDMKRRRICSWITRLIHKGLFNWYFKWRN